MNIRKRNIFWGVYDQKGRVVSISKDRDNAKREALSQSGHRWTEQSLESDWRYLEMDGWHLLKSIIMPISETKENYKKVNEIR